MSSNKDLLIIDDELVIVDAIKKIAESEGLSSDICINVEEAIANLSKNTYRLIISDIMMPGKDGFELIKIIHQKKIPTPIVVTTGFSTLENAVKSLYEGAVGFIPKPFSIDELISIIRRGIEYGKIFGNRYEFKLNEKRYLPDFVPCPPRYFRLGYDSWMNNAEEGLVSVGITDLFLKSIGTLKEIEFMNIGDTIYQGGACLKIINTNDCTHQLLSPISGNILDMNEKVIVNKSLLEKDPYFEGWIYKMIPNNIEYELNNITPCSTDI
jgi:CheY-like chemotaxis protein/glycine cleavage system H lipoate-binding protein